MAIISKTLLQLKEAGRVEVTSKTGFMIEKLQKKEFNEIKCQLLLLLPLLLVSSLSLTLEMTADDDIAFVAAATK